MCRLGNQRWCWDRRLPGKVQWLPFFATPGAERKENMQVTRTLNNLFVHFQLFADRRSCTFIFFPGQAELHFHFSCPPKTAVAQNESQFTTELDGFSVKSLRSTFSKLTPATLFWTYLIVEVLWLNWLTKMWRNTKHEIRKLFLPAFLLWKILILKEGLRLPGLIHSCGTSVKPDGHWLSIIYLSLIERSCLFCCCSKLKSLTVG